MKAKEKPMKTSKHYRGVFERLVKYFDDINILAYTRIDVQVLNGVKNYFQAIALKQDGEKKGNFYICTQNLNKGVTTLDELPKAWLDMLLSRMQEDRFSDLSPAKLQELRAFSIEELEVKMGILGI